MLPYLFVYGTLRRGQALHHELVKAQAEFVAVARMRGRLCSLGRYPGALAEGDQVIVGELYRLPTPQPALERLDTVEGDEFRRAVVRVFVAGGGIRRAWAYLLKSVPPV